ncbi:MAG: transglycosylase SLT domain-containing protein [Proteobacteria bacterium]|nr:transglycosylase SLT domain-containing protein [Pseudomonadota bacterium]
MLAVPMIALALALAAPRAAHAGAQVEEQLSAAVVMGLQHSIADNPVPADYAKRPDVREWIDAVAPRLAKQMPDAAMRAEFLATVHYEAARAGLSPRLVLGVIHHESYFRKYAISSAGARGYMQVMPFWVKQIGSPDQDLFQLRTNLRYGCTILRYYLDAEKGNLYRALGRYNGSLGQPDYPYAVIAAERLYTVGPEAHAEAAVRLQPRVATSPAPAPGAAGLD